MKNEASLLRISRNPGFRAEEEDIDSFIFDIEVWFLVPRSVGSPVARYYSQYRALVDQALLCPELRQEIIEKGLLGCDSAQKIGWCSVL